MDDEVELRLEEFIKEVLDVDGESRQGSSTGLKLVKSDNGFKNWAVLVEAVLVEEFSFSEIDSVVDRHASNVSWIFTVDFNVLSGLIVLSSAKIFSNML